MRATQPGPAEHLRDRTAGAQQCGALQRQHQVLHERPRASFLDTHVSSKRRAQALDGAGMVGIVAGRRPQFLPQPRSGFRLLRQCAQHVQALDVAAAFPDRVERRLPVQARQNRFLDVAVAAEAFLRFVDERRGALADPVFADRGGDPRKRSFRLVVWRGIDCPRDAHREDQRRFGFDRQVGEHVAHQRLLDQPPAEGAAMAAMVDRLRQRHAHDRGGSEHAVQPRQHHHFEDGGDAAPLVADAMRPRAAELDFRRGVRPVAELVFQPQQPERILRTIGPVPRQQEAGQPIRCLREHQEGIGHRRREEPLVANQRVFARLRERCRGGGVGAHVGTALFLGHAHADGDAAFAADRHVARVVVECRGLACPVAQRGFAAQDRHRGVGHRQRTTGAGFGLRMQVAQRGAGDVRAGLRLRPRQAGDAMLDRRLHQRVVVRMEFDLVDAVTEAVMRAQARPVAMGIETQPVQRIARERAVIRDATGECTCTLALHRFAQHDIVGPQVARRELRWLVVDHMGLIRRQVGHGGSAWRDRWILAQWEVACATRC